MNNAEVDLEWQRLMAECDKEDAKIAPEDQHLYRTCAVCLSLILREQYDNHLRDHGYHVFDL